MKSNLKNSFSSVIDRIEDIIRAIPQKNEVETLDIFLNEMTPPTEITPGERKSLSKALLKWRKSRPAPSKREREVQKRIETLAAAPAAQ